MIFDELPSITATQELVVPRSIPIIFAILFLHSRRLWPRVFYVTALNKAGSKIFKRQRVLSRPSPLPAGPTAHAIDTPFELPPSPSWAPYQGFQ